MFSWFFSVIFFSPGNMSSDVSPPRVRQRTEESVTDRRHRMQTRQVISERIRADLRDPILLLLVKCFRRTSGSTYTTVPARPFPEWWEILWQHDHHPGWWQRTDHVDNGQRTTDSDWSTAYQCCDRSTCFTSLRSSFSSWWWGSQHWLSAWFLWHETVVQIST